MTFLSQIMIFVFYLEQFHFFYNGKNFMLETKLVTANIEVLEKQEEIGAGKNSITKKSTGDCCLLVFAIHSLSGNHYNNLCFPLPLRNHLFTTFHKKLPTKSTAITILVPRDSRFSRELPTFDWSNICTKLLYFFSKKTPSILKNLEKFSFLNRSTFFSSFRRQ